MNDDTKKDIKKVVATIGKIGLVAGVVAVAIGALPFAKYTKPFSSQALKVAEDGFKNLDKWVEKK